MGAHKICVAVNKRAPHQYARCDRTWGAVCGRSTTARVSAHRNHLGGGEGKFRGSILEQDKARRRLRLRAVTAARSADRFQDFYGQEEGFSELFGKFKRGSL